jgi:tetratricopeptide (TPR) repeat protein
MLLVVLFVNYSWCQSNQDNVSIVKWGKAGSNPNEYNMGGDPFSLNVNQAGFVKFIGDVSEGFGTLSTGIKPNKYLGKRVKLSVSLKTENVEKWASMWMRVDGEDKLAISFDNMQERALKGDNNWNTYEIVLDVPKNSTSVVYGVMLVGKGQIWAKDLQFKIVDESVALTDMNQMINYLMTGNYQKALPLLEKYLQENGTDNYKSLFYYISLIETGKKEQGKIFINDFAKKQPKDEWITKIALFLNSDITEKALLKASNNKDHQIDKGQKCEAYYYIGIDYKFDKNISKAKEYFKKSIATNEKDFYEYGMSEIELESI